MSVRSSSMDPPDRVTPDTSVEIQDTSNRRKSGRARHKPVLLSQDPNLAQSSRAGSAKRKLAALGDDTGEGEAERDEDEGADSKDSESSPAEEELRVNRKNPSKKLGTKRAQKKAKTNDVAGTSTTLPVRPAVNGVKKASRPRKAPSKASATEPDEADGLFGK